MVKGIFTEMQIFVFVMLGAGITIGIETRLSEAKKQIEIYKGEAQIAKDEAKEYKAANSRLGMLNWNLRQRLTDYELANKKLKAELHSDFGILLDQYRALELDYDRCLGIPEAARKKLFLPATSK